MEENCWQRFAVLSLSLSVALLSVTYICCVSINCIVWRHCHITIVRLVELMASLETYFKRSCWPLGIPSSSKALPGESWSIADLKGGGRKGLWSCGFVLFLVRFCGNFHFNLRYCGFKTLSGLRHLVVYMWPLTALLWRNVLLKKEQDCCLAKYSVTPIVP